MAGEKALKPLINMERETGFEPATLALARRCSTAELFPRIGMRRSPLKIRKFWTEVNIPDRIFEVLFLVGQKRTEKLSADKGRIFAKTDQVQTVVVVRHQKIRNISPVKEKPDIFSQHKHRADRDLVAGLGGKGLDCFHESSSHPLFSGPLIHEQLADQPDSLHLTATDSPENPSIPSPGYEDPCLGEFGTALLRSFPCPDRNIEQGCMSLEGRSLKKQKLRNIRLIEGQNIDFFHRNSNPVDNGGSYSSLPSLIWNNASLDFSRFRRTAPSSFAHLPDRKSAL